MKKRVALINTFAKSPEGSFNYKSGDSEEDYTHKGRMDRIYEDNQLLIKEIKKYFDVVVYDDLWETADRIEYALQLEGPFDFIITSIPYEKDLSRERIGTLHCTKRAVAEKIHYTRRYAQSYEALDRIHKFLLKKSPKTKIIVNSSPPSKELKRLLKKHHVSHVIGWMETKNPLLYAWNELKDVIVDRPQRIGSLLERFISKINSDHKLSEGDLEFISKEVSESIDLTLSDIENIVVSEKGFTSKRGFAFRDLFIKVDLASRLEHELEVYGKDLGAFNAFRPKAHIDKFEFSDEDHIGILTLDNLRLYPPGTEKVKKIFGIGFKDCGLLYNILLMSLFHKEASVHKDNFSQLQYEGVHGLPHFEESSQPFFNTDGEGLKRFEETKLENFGVLPVITAYLTLQKEEAKSVIHGDWKPENMVNGHLVDYAMVGRGFEVDELAYYLSDAKFNCDLEKFHRFIDDYIKFRSSHDIEFKYKIHEGYGEKMHELANSAFLTQLVLRHSVMNKRDMMDDSKYKQRKYYQCKINKMKGGKFI